MASVFLSYRRQDSSGWAGRIHDRLVEHWGVDRVFRDIDNIEPGEDFIEVINRTLAQCGAVLIVIGPRWANILSERHKQNAFDLHQLEVEMALQSKVRVIPVLVDGASVPAKSALPETLRPLVRRDAFEISDRRFKDDIVKLTAAIDRALNRAQAERENRLDEERARLNDLRRKAEETVMLEAARQSDEPKRLEPEQARRRESWNDLTHGERHPEETEQTSRGSTAVAASATPPDFEKLVKQNIKIAVTVVVFFLLLSIFLFVMKP